MKIAILGGVHGCCAAAADLSEAGHEVRLWRRNAAALAPVIEAGAIANEAARMVDEGVASAVEIDKATRYGLGLRFAARGVVELIDQHAGLWRVPVPDTQD